jgi:hypothetical protein
MGWREALNELDSALPGPPAVKQLKKTIQKCLHI